LYFKIAFEIIYLLLRKYLKY